MAINVRQWPSTRLESYPDFGSVGCVCFTYNAGATAAQVAADDSLFNNWTLLAAGAVGRSGPVTVYLESDLVVTGTTALNNFPAGSSLIGAGALRGVALSGSVGLRGISLFANMLIGGDLTGTPPLGDTGIVFDGCEFAHTGGVVWGTGANGSDVTFHGCMDQGAAILGATQEVISITGASSDQYSIQLEGGTVAASNFLVANNVAYFISFNQDQSAGASALQTQAAGASLTVNYRTASLAAANLDSAQNLATGDHVWPTAGANEQAQLMVQVLFVSTDGSGAVNLNVGRSTAFVQGQMLSVINTGNNANVITLRTAAGANIRNGTVGGGAAASGVQNAVSMVFHNNAGGPGTPGWEVMSGVDNA